MIYQKELELNLNVCPHCDNHLRMPIDARLSMLFDGGDYQCIELPQPAVDPLKFKDKKKYPDRLKEYQAKTGEKDCAVDRYQNGAAQRAEEIEIGRRGAKEMIVDGILYGHRG